LSKTELYSPDMAIFAVQFISLYFSKSFSNCHDNKAINPENLN